MPRCDNACQLRVEYTVHRNALGDKKDAINGETKPSASIIDKYVKQIIENGGNDEDLLVSMYDYMGTFKQLLDTSTQQKMDELCQRYDGFYRFALLLDLLAEGIADGIIQVPE